MTSWWTTATLAPLLALVGCEAFIAKESRLEAEEGGSTGDASHAALETDDGSTGDEQAEEYDSGGLHTGCGFLCCGFDVGPSFECDVWTQDCPAGQKCSPWDNMGEGTWNATRCTPVGPSPDGVGEPCTVEGSPRSGVDSCALGSVCWAVDPETREGTCVQQCKGSEPSPDCPEDTACSVTNDGALNLCLRPCDPLADSCDEGHACRPAKGVEHTQYVCRPMSNGMVDYGDCGCAAGEFCVAATNLLDCEDDLGCCTPYCDLDDPTSTGACESRVEGHECQPYFTNAPELEHVGGCGVVSPEQPEDDA